MAALGVADRRTDYLIWTASPAPGPDPGGDGVRPVAVGAENVRPSAVHRGGDAPGGARLDDAQPSPTKPAEASPDQVLTQPGASQAGASGPARPAMDCAAHDLGRILAEAMQGRP